jgi:flagellar motor switch protein FliN/FliY
MTVAVTADTLSAAGAAVAGALAGALDLEVAPLAGRPGADLVPGLGVRAVALPIGATTILLAVSGELATVLEQHLGSLGDALTPPLAAAADAVGGVPTAGVDVLDAGGVAAALANAPESGAVRLVHDGDVVGAVVVLQEATRSAAPDGSGPADAAPAAHEFAPIGRPAAPVATPGRSMDLLGDVEMGVTAELGRTRMLVRDIVALTPGAVIELDRAAGSPVDVLVNGTLIARGEVVVVDEEFGIRITEIVGADGEVRR